MLKNSDLQKKKEQETIVNGLSNQTEINPYAIDLTFDKSALERDLTEKIQHLSLITHSTTISKSKFMPYCA